MVKRAQKSILKLLAYITIPAICLILNSKIIVLQAQGVEATEKEAKKTLVAKVDNYTYSTEEQIPSTHSWGVDDHYSSVAPINDFWGSDGNYHIVYSGEKKVYIYVLDSKQKIVNTLEIPKELPIVGNAIQDQSGNYYIAYGKYDTVSESTKENGKQIVMSIVQYSSNGTKLNKLTYTGIETDPYGNTDFGTKNPFSYANCEMIIDVSGTIVCRYGRVMYNGHQSSHTLYVDSATMTKLKYVSPYTSHSFNQKVIATSDGGYLFAERGDAYDRGIVISKLYKGTKNVWSVPSFVPFHFRNGYIYQTTYATIAGIAELTNGYALVGASEKTLSYDKAKDSKYNESRNIFMQVFKKDFTSDSSNSSDVQLLQGETRVAVGSYVSGTGNTEAGATDYGVQWLTNYTGEFYASVPKMIDIGNDQLLIMWEKKQNSTDYLDDYYIESYYMVVNSDGSIEISPTIIQDVRLPEYGSLDYKDGKVYWTNSDGTNNTLQLHILTIGETMTAKIKVTNLKVNQENIIAIAGKKTPIEVTILPTNADNKQVEYEYDTDMIAIDSKGNITVKALGVTEVYLYSEDNDSVNGKVTIYATDSVPTKLKATNSGNNVKLTWKKTKLNQSYEIYRSTNKNKGYEYIGYSDSLDYSDTWVKEGTTYYYKVKAANYWWDSEHSQNPFSDPVAIYSLKAPKNLKVKKHSSSSVQLTWTQNSKAEGTEIYHYDATTKSYKHLKTISSKSTTLYKHTSLKPGISNSYKIRSYKTVNGVKHYSSFSKAVKITL